MSRRLKDQFYWIDHSGGQGGSQREPRSLGAFFWFVFCRGAENEHKNLFTRAQFVRGTATVE